LVPSWARVLPLEAEHRLHEKSLNQDLAARNLPSWDLAKMWQPEGEATVLIVGFLPRYAVV
jgi:hypothetical protein